VTFWQKDIDAKVSPKMLMKLTVGSLNTFGLETIATTTEELELDDALTRKVLRLPDS